jgi:hypothetical protein
MRDDDPVLLAPGVEEAMYKNLTAAAAKLGTFMVYRPAELPPEYGLGGNPSRMPGFFCMCENADSYPTVASSGAALILKIAE